MVKLFAVACVVSLFASCSDAGKGAESSASSEGTNATASAAAAATKTENGDNVVSPAAAAVVKAAPAPLQVQAPGVDAATVSNIVSSLTSQLTAAHAAETKKLAETMIAAQQASDQAAAKRAEDARAERKAAEDKAEKLAAAEKAEAKAAAEKAEKLAAAEKAEAKAAAERAEKERKEAEAKAEKRLAEEKAANEKRLAEEKAAEEVRKKTIGSRTFRLQFASADDVAEKLNAMWSGDFGEKWKTAKVAQSFPDANVVMVSAPGAILDDCEKVIQAVDVPAQQVYIEARFVELSSEAFHNLGIDWGMLNGMKGSVSLGGGYESYKLGDAVQNFARTVANGTGSDKLTYGLADRTSAHETTRTVTTAADGKQSSTETTKSTATTSGSDGSITRFTGTLDFSDLYMVLYALEGAQDARVFSNPKIIVSSGKDATVDMTTKYPNVNISAKRTTSGSSDALDLSMSMASIPGEDKFMFAKESFFSWGITLKVTPRILTNGVINVEIVPTISSQTDWVTASTGDTSSGDVNAGTYSSKYPVIEVQRLITEFDMKSESTAVIGGLSRTVEEQVDNGIPYLRDIPWIGEKLFGNKIRRKTQKEILVFVTVGIVDCNNIKRDAGLPMNAVMGREYTEGKRKEPGERRSGTASVTALDLRTLEEQAADPLRTNQTLRSSSPLPMPFTKKR